MEQKALLFTKNLFAGGSPAKCIGKLRLELTRTADSTLARLKGELRGLHVARQYSFQILQDSFPLAAPVLPNGRSIFDFTFAIANTGDLTSRPLTLSYLVDKQLAVFSAGTIEPEGDSQPQPAAFTISMTLTEQYPYVESFADELLTTHLSTQSQAPEVLQSDAVRNFWAKRDHICAVTLELAQALRQVRHGIPMKRQDYNSLSEVLTAEYSHPQPANERFTKLMTLLGESGDGPERYVRGQHRFHDTLPYAWNSMPSGVGSWLSTTCGAMQWPTTFTYKVLMEEITRKNVRTIIILGDADPYESIPMNSYWTWPGFSTQPPFDEEKHGIWSQWKIRLNAPGEPVLRMIHYATWNDMRSPEAGSENDTCMHMLVDSLNAATEDATALVHCRAGVGRTGTLITLARCWKDIQETGSTDFLGRWLEARVQRRIMIQRPEQMEYVAKTLADWSARLLPKSASAVAADLAAPSSQSASNSGAESAAAAGGP